MTIQQLLIPRIKIITRWPMMPRQLKEGMILSLDKFGAGKWWHEYTEDEPLHLEESTAKTYPKNLKLLEWWEERGIEDMPEYVKQSGYVDSFGGTVPTKFFKVKKHFSAGTGNWRDDTVNCFCFDRDIMPINANATYSGYEPATIEEYEAQQKTNPC